MYFIVLSVLLVNLKFHSTPPAESLLADQSEIVTGDSGFDSGHFDQTISPSISVIVLESSSLTRPIYSTY